MKCYYEVLGISKEAEDSEIKTAYKKLALQWHPDKNPDNQEEAKEQFQLLQQAYEVLSDKQERAWYDKHREEILRGRDKNYEDNSLDVFQYFTTSCFKGYGDDVNGFYTVYNKVFEQLAKEDMEFMEDKEEFCSIPMFGTSSSDYDDIVAPFYNYWLCYSTKKSFAWLDPYDVREARERRLSKLIEKENKKCRLKAKKERNEEVRNLVFFIRKRDKRVQAHNKLMEMKSKENKQKQEELSKQKRMERRKEMTSNKDKQAEWTKFDNVKCELKEIEKSLAEEFGEDISNSEDEEIEEEINDSLYCVACNKLFKTPKAFQNHESSKKHKANVEALKESMLEEEEDITDLESEEDVEEVIDSLYCGACNQLYKTRKAYQNHELSKKHKSNIEALNEKQNSDIELSNNDNESETVENETDEDSVSLTQTSTKQKKQKMVLNVETDEEVDISLKVVESEGSDFDSSKKQKKKTRRKKKSADPTTVPESSDNIDEAKPLTVKRNKKNKNKTAKKNESIEEEVVDKDHCCVSCKSKFDSKNKLFEHLKKTGHSVYLPKSTNHVDVKKKSIK